MLLFHNGQNAVDNKQQITTQQIALMFWCSTLAYN